MANAVVPESSTMESPGSTISAARFPIRRFSSTWMTCLVSTAGSLPALMTSVEMAPP